MAYIAPIHKKNDRKMVSNYRPISLTCITCKVMEKIIYQQIIDHIQINIYISDSQHGFLKGTDHVGTFMGLKCVVYYANYRSGNQSSKIQVVP